MTDNGNTEGREFTPAQQEFIDLLTKVQAEAANLGTNADLLNAIVGGECNEDFGQALAVATDLTFLHHVREYGPQVAPFALFLENVTIGQLLERHRSDPAYGQEVASAKA